MTTRCLSCEYTGVVTRQVTGPAKVPSSRLMRTVSMTVPSVSRSFLSVRAAFVPDAATGETTALVAAVGAAVAVTAAVGDVAALPADPGTIGVGSVAGADDGVAVGTGALRGVASEGGS